MDQKAQVAPEVRKGVTQLLAWSMLLGLATVPVYALYSADRSQVLVARSVGSLLCGAAALTGVLLGFLFGIPRTQQAGSNRAPTPPTDAGPLRQARTKPPQPVETGSQTAQPPSVSHHPNTNLEEISDWLTKILVGVGLTQIDAIRQGFFELTRQAALGAGQPAPWPDLCGCPDRILHRAGLPVRLPVDPAVSCRRACRMPTRRHWARWPRACSRPRARSRISRSRSSSTLPP